MPEYLDPVRYLGNMQNHQKMYDFERDILRVKNPLNEDFTFMYDSTPIVVPSGRTKDMERYLVRRFIWAMIGHVYNTFATEAMHKYTEAFQRTHPDVIDDPYLLNEKIYLKIKRSDDPEFQQKVIKDCILGVVSKFGANRIVPNKPQNGQLNPNTPLYDQLINDFKVVGMTDTKEEGSAEAPLMADQPLPTQPASVAEATI